MIKIEICDSLESIEYLKPEWNKLSSECRVRNIFLSYHWIYNWFKTGDGSFRPLLITGRENNKLVSLLPFAVKSKIIYPAGYPESDFIDIISLEEYEISFLEEVCAFLSHNSSMWDIAYIKTVTEHSHLCNYFIRNKQNSNTITEIFPYSKCPIAEFPKGWNIYLNDLSPKFRSNLRRREKIAAESGDVTLSIYGKDSIDKNILSQVIAINIAGRKSENKSVFFQNSNHISFFTELIKSDINPELLIALLFLGSTPVAYKICFKTEDEVWEYNTSFREEYHRASPGLLLTAKLIQQLSESGVKKYNFLKGDEQYKSNYANYCENLYILAIRNNKFKSTMKYLVNVKLRMLLNRFDTLRNIYDRLTDKN